MNDKFNSFFNINLSTKAKWRIGITSMFILAFPFLMLGMSNSINREFENTLFIITSLILVLFFGYKKYC